MTAPLEAIYCGELLTPTRRLANTLMQIERGKVAALERDPDSVPASKTVYDARDAIVIPGLIDLQVNGGLGWSFQAEHQAHFAEALGFHLAAGTTSLLPTLITAPENTLTESLARLAAAVGDQGPERPFVPGIHLEGPFLSPEKSGAHDPGALRLPDLALTQRFMEAAQGHIRIFTLAPELAGAEEVIRWLAGRGVIISAGHTAATYDELRQAMDWGLSFATHIGNASDWPHRAMGTLGFLSSQPGLMGTLMAEDALGGSIILDGFHFHPALLPPLLRLKGSNQLAFISDASTVAGCAPGAYESGGLVVTVHPEGFATSGRGGGWLAGSTITLLQAVQRAVKLAKLPLQHAVHLASLSPARRIGIEARKGQLEPGCDADLLVLNQDLSLREVIVGGRRLVG